MVSVKVDLKKRDLVFVGLFVVLISVGIVVAYGSGTPAVHGHDVGEIEGVGNSEGGPITTKDSDGTTMVMNRAYKAQVAGFVSAKISGAFQFLEFYVGASANPVSTGNHMFSAMDQSWGDQGGTIFVPKDNYFEIKVSAGTATIYWTPLILDGANPINQD